MLRFLIFIFLDVLAFSGILIVILPFLAKNLGASIFIVTILFATFSFFQLFVSPLWGSLSDKYGRKPLLILNCFAEIIANILLLVSGSIILIFFSRIVAGLFKTNVAVGTAYIADITDNQNRAKGMGLFGMAFGLGFTIGPLLGGIIAGSNYSNETLSFVILIAIGINIANLLYVLFFVNESKKNNSSNLNKQASNKNLLSQFNIIKSKELIFLFLIVFILHFNFSGMESTIALWSNATFSWGPKEIGILMTSAGLVQILIQGGLLRILLEKFNEEQLIKSSSFALFFGFLTIATGKLLLIPLAIFLLCYGMGIGNPCLNSLISKKSPSEERGLALGAAYSSQAAARVMGQPFAGLLALLVFKDAPYFASAIIIIFSIIVYFFIKNRAYKT